MHSAMNYLRKLEKLLVSAITNISIAMFATIIAVTASQVFMRRVFNRPIIWAEDLTVFLFIWLTFLGAAILHSKKGLLCIDTIINVFPEKIRTIVGFVMEFITLVFLSYLMSLSVQFFNKQFALGNKLGGALGVPAYAATLSVIVAVIIMCVSSIVSIYDLWQKR